MDLLNLSNQIESLCTRYGTGYGEISLLECSKKAVYTTKYKVIQLTSILEEIDDFRKIHGNIGNLEFVERDNEIKFVHFIIEFILNEEGQFHPVSNN